MGDQRLRPQELLENLEREKEKMESLCKEFEGLLSEEPSEEGNDDIFRLEEVLSGIEDEETGSTTTSKTTATTTSEEEDEEDEDEEEARRGTGLERGVDVSDSSESNSVKDGSDFNEDDNPLLPAIGLGKVIVQGTIPKFRMMIQQHLEDPSSALSVDELNKKWQDLQIIITEANKRFTDLRKKVSEAEKDNTESPIE